MKKLAVTCGDPAGVGPEILLQWARDRPEQAHSVVLVGGRSWLDHMREAGDFECCELGPPTWAAVPGHPTPEGARLAWDCLECVAEGCARGDFSAAVTGPVSKEALAKVGFPFPGQTEFFGARWKGEPVMGFQGERLRVVLATWHMPLAEVPRALNEATVERAIRAAVELARFNGLSRPRIAVCGLNPHAGENGLLGSEERDWIDPFLDRIRNEIHGISGAVPGDTAFWRMLRGEFDLVVALYHDQGLAPLKVLEFDKAVNVTLGLPWLRVAPDHGVGYSLAGTGRADPVSFSRAIEFALKHAGSGGRA